MFSGPRRSDAPAESLHPYPARAFVSGAIYYTHQSRVRLVTAHITHQYCTHQLRRSVAGASLRP
jgi:hypothetical protein